MININNDKEKIKVYLTEIKEFEFVKSEINKILLWHDDFAKLKIMWCIESVLIINSLFRKLIQIFKTQNKNLSIGLLLKSYAFTEEIYLWRCKTIIKYSLKTECMFISNTVFLRAQKKKKAWQPFMCVGCRNVNFLMCFLFQEFQLKNWWELYESYC